jgi:hypothetical protein
VKLEDLGSSITDNQFMNHTLNNMTLDYYLQSTMMEKRIDDKVNPVRIGEIRDDLKLCFERLNMKVRTLRCLVVSSRENAKIVGP